MKTPINASFYNLRLDRWAALKCKKVVIKRWVPASSTSDVKKALWYVVGDDGVTGSSPVCGTGTRCISPNELTLEGRPFAVRWRAVGAGKYRGRFEDLVQEATAVNSMVPPRPASVEWLRRRWTRLRRYGNRNSVLPSVGVDRNNRLVNFAVDNSDSVAELLNHAKADTEKAAIKDKAKQGAVYSLDDTIVVNSKNKGAAMCTGLLYVRIGDTTVQKEIDFRVEQAADGKISVSVKPFQF